MASPFILLLQPRLLENAVQSSGRKVNVGFSGNRDRPGPGWVVKLTVAPRNSDLRPPVRFQHGDHGFDLHDSTVPAKDAGSGPRGRPRDSYSCLSTSVVVALAAVEFAGLHAAVLETGGRSRTGRGRCGRASRGVPCHRGPLGRRGGHGFRKGNPFLRLLLVSKTGEIVDAVDGTHDGPPVMGAVWLQGSGIVPKHSHGVQADLIRRDLAITSNSPKQAPRGRFVL